jgi:hypothetical protein
MLLTGKESTNVNLFYLLKNKRWYKRLEPVNLDIFKEILINISKYCDDIFKEDINKLKNYYCIYLQNFNNMPSYKKSKPHQFLKFEGQCTRLSYYTDRGYMEKFALELLRDRQTQTSKQAFIRKYGKDTGVSHFNSYTDKWKASIAKHDKQELYKNWKNIPETYLKKINPETSLLYTFNEAEIKIKADLSKGFKKLWAEYKTGIRDKSFISTTLDYYLKKGLSIHEARIALKQRQSTFSLEICIAKFGKEKGLNRWNLRQQKWQTSIKNKTQKEQEIIMLKKIRNLPRYSKEATDFFTCVLDNLKLNYQCFYGANEIILYDKELKKPYFYDFAIPDLKLIIEYNGSTFHPNFETLSKNDIKKWICPYTKLDAFTKRDIDEKKIKFAKTKGYDILVVWDKDEYNSKLSKCLNFINLKLINKNE